MRLPPHELTPSPQARKLNLIMCKSTILAMPQGKERRAAILHLLSLGSADAPTQMAVNLKHCPQLSQDADLRQLLKKGLLVRKRVSLGGGKPRVLQLNEGSSKKPVFKDSGKRITVLCLAP